MIIDKNGRPFKPVAYGRHGASHIKKSLSSWVASAMAPDDDITENVDTLRARSRDLFMGCPLATGALKTLRTNVVGSGLMLNSHVNKTVLGLSDEQAEEWEAQTEREWLNWSSTNRCDAGRMFSFYQLQGLVLLSALMSGDVFVGLPHIKRPGDLYGLKLYLIEADRVCDPQDGTPYIDKDVLEGVELGDYGEPVAYYVARYHPYTLRYGRSLKPQKWTRVSAFGTLSGRRQILHVMQDVERPGQRRGVPVLAPVMESLKQLERYSNAELMAAVVAGLFTVFVTSADGGGMSGFEDALMGADGTSPERDIALGNGTVVDLQAGESVSTATPGRPNANFGGFVDAILNQIGSALELPRELLLKAFTSSYSASRAALLEAWKMIRTRRQWMVDSFCQPVYEEWLTEAVLTGQINAPGFLEDPRIRAAWCGADWSGDAQGSLDPSKEASAAVTRIEAGLSTREREAAELTGMAFNTIVAQQAKEKRLSDEAGLNFDSKSQGTPQPITQDQGENDGNNTN